MLRATKAIELPRDRLLSGNATGRNWHVEVRHERLVTGNELGNP